ncbi:hypothetical protein Tco_1061568, partial [Tanacetum coccineum]
MRSVTPPFLHIAAEANLGYYFRGTTVIIIETDDLDAYNSDCNELNTAKMMPSSEQSNVVTHSETEITSDSNIIPYSQYVIESQQAVVQNSNSSTQQDALILSIIEQLKTQEPTLSSRPTNVEVPKELSKVSKSQEKDTVIKKLKERIKSLSGKMDKDKIKQDFEEIETINIELDHRVTKLIAENEHLKQTYKQFYDSIKPAPLKNDLRKLKGKALADNAVTKHTIDPNVVILDLMRQNKYKNETKGLKLKIHDGSMVFQDDRMLLLVNSINSVYIILGEQSMVPGEAFIGPSISTAAKTRSDVRAHMWHFVVVVVAGQIIRSAANNYEWANLSYKPTWAWFH